MPAILTLTAAGAAFFGGATAYNRRARPRSKVLVQALQPPAVIEPHPPTPLAALRQQGQQLQKSLAVLLTDFEEEYQRVVKTKIDPLFGAVRTEQIEALKAPDSALVITPYERYINRNLGISALITTAALVTTRMHPLVQAAATIPLVFYVVKGIYKVAYTSLVQQRKLTLPVLSAVNVTALWLGGYYLIGGVIFMLIYLGMKLSFITEDRSHKQLANIFGQQPRKVWVLSDGVEVEIPFEQLQVGDILVVGAGQMIVADGVIIEGYASIDQHRLTGESQPAEKGVGESVLSATVVLAGQIHVQVEKAGKETVAAQIGEMLEKTASYQMDITTKAYRIAESSVMPTLLAAGAALLTVGYSGMVAITSTIFGFNLRISGPMALLNYLNVASRQRILIKDGRSLELLTAVDTVVFDKTGTLTLDQPHVTQVHTFGELDEQSVLRYAAAVEQRQSHPIARAILAHAKEQAITLPKLDETSYEMGYGLRAGIEGRLIRVGSDRFMTIEALPLPDVLQSLQQACHAQGHSLVMVAVDDQVVGAIELEPTIRPEAKAVIDELRQRGLDFYIISGDQEGPTRQLAQTLGIANYFANTLPENKAQLVEQLQQEGRAVCFVGDGINDSIALKKANVSVSLSGATSIATDTAQVVLMDATLQQLPLLFRLAADMDTNLKTSLALAIVPGLGIWAGVFFFHLGILGAAALYEASLWLGMANAFRPLLTYRTTAEES
ncbi:MAG: heavy metal translocating P-type ATPase [Caldilineaceae bacterium]|nr:heavy metal translocating P-type ATPase [Caldilineaceae bacterium]